MKRQLIVLGISGVLLGAGIVGAQENGSGGEATQSQATESQAAETESTETAAAATERATMLAHALLRRPLDMGSTLTITLYDGDPEAGGSELSSLEFVYGEDSEAAFAEALAAAAAEAAYVSVTTSPQTETYNLSETQLGGPDGFGRGFGGHGPGEGFGGRFGEGRN